MRWKILFADSSIIRLDTIVSDWMSFNQIHGGCQLYDGSTCENGGSIAYGGGIFNDNVKANSSDNSEYWFRYRAMPDSAKVAYNIDIGRWMSFTYDIFWTHSDSGYWKLWKDGELLGSADNVKTLPDCCDDDANFLQFKTGLYNKWNDPEIDSLPLYFDDLELYIGEDIRIENVCPECIDTSAVRFKKPVLQKRIKEQMISFSTPVKDNLVIQGKMIPYNISIYSPDGKEVSRRENSRVITISHLSNGMYIAAIEMKGSLIVRHFVK